MPLVPRYRHAPDPPDLGRAVPRARRHRLGHAAADRRCCRFGSSKIVITLPTSVTRGRLTAARVSLPGSVAALDGRVLVSSKAAEVVGVAVPRKGISLMPVAIKGGYAFGAYNLRAAHGRTVVDVVLLPHKSGSIGIKVAIDSMADAHGRRIACRGARPAGLRPAPWASPRHPARPAPARAPGSTPRGTGTARFAIPVVQRPRHAPAGCPRPAQHHRDQPYLIPGPGLRPAGLDPGARQGQCLRRIRGARPQRRRLRRHRRPPGDPGRARSPRGPLCHPATADGDRAHQDEAHDHHPHHAHRRHPGASEAPRRRAGRDPMHPGRARGIRPTRRLTRTCHRGRHRR